MRIINIAVLIFCVNIAIAVMNSAIVAFPEYNAFSGSTVSGFVNPESSSIANDVSSKGYDMGSTEANSQSIFSYFNMAWKGFITVISTLITFTTTMIAGFIVIGYQFGLPMEFMVPLQAIAWISYALGMLQWYSGRSFREAQ